MPDKGRSVGAYARQRRPESFSRSARSASFSCFAQTAALSVQSRFAGRPHGKERAEKAPPSMRVVRAASRIRAEKGIGLVFSAFRTARESDQNLSLILGPL